MSILSKIFGRAETQNDSDSKRTLRLRSDRICIHPLRQIYFRRNLDGLALEIGNLTMSGVGLVYIDDLAEPQKGAILEGCFLFERIEYPVILKVIHHTGRILGCSFQGDLSQLSEFFSRYLSFELEGIRLEQVNPAVLKQERIGTPQWFKGNDQSELFFVEDEGHIVRFELSFLGNYLEWQENKHVRHGLVVRDEDIGKSKHKASELIVWKDSSEEITELARRFVMNIRDLSEKNKSELVRILGA